MVQIEILSKSGQNVSAIFNYYVPAQNQLVGASDQQRSVYGIQLTAQEQQDVRDGKIWQVLFNSNFSPNMTIGQLGAELVRLYNESASDAQKDYNNRFKWVAKYYNGSNWV